MNNKEIVNAVNYWQNTKAFHPLTCIKHSDIALLPIEKDGKVILICPKCDYAQNYIPEVIIKTYKKSNTV